MKRTMIMTVLALAGAPAFAQPSASTATTPRAAPNAPNPAEFDKQMAQAQDDLKKMQAQMDRLRQTQDPQERQRLLQEHWSTMQNAMRIMHGVWGQGMLGCCGGPGQAGHMGGGPMMGGMMGWGNAGGFYSNLTPEQLRQRQYMTDQYLALQQQMMSHMMWHQHWLNQPPPARK